MVERFNKTLLNMLGTLQDHQKSDWQSHVPTLNHAYNAAVHDSTGYSPFYLLYGRHPRLAIDAFLGLTTDALNANTRKDYGDKLKDRLRFAYQKANEEARRAGEKNYDEKVRHALLEVGDRVLVRNFGLKGRQKLADK